VPLRALPTEIGNWTGKDVPVTETVQRVAAADDFLNRLYINKATDQWTNVYVAYSARPRNMQGHRPQVCYVAAGWIHDGTEHTKVISKSGRDVPCLLHRFHWPAPDHQEKVVLNFYIVNGQTTRDERVFTNIGWRTPNISGDPARYVTQVQISSVLENSVRTAAKDMTDFILDFLPDKNGEVRAMKYSNTAGGVLR